MPDVSVVIPAYNRARYLPEAIESALAQTLPPFEIIVADDGSTDDTNAVLSRYDVRVVRQPNRGPASARNLGAANARGEYIAFLDSDDVWLPRKLDLQLARFASDPSLGLVHCGYDDGTKQSTAGLEGRVALDLLRLEREVISGPGSTLVIPRRVFEEVHGFDERLRISEDWDLCYRIATRYPVGYVREALVRYRQHGDALHLDVPEMERGMLLAFEKAFATTDPEVLAVRREAYGRLHRMLAGSYFRARRPAPFLSHMLKSLRHDPRNIGYFVRYPLRALARR